MFIGREEELGALNRLYEEKGLRCAVVYGRRGVGKTTLLNEFSKGKEVIYFMGLDSTPRQNVDNLYRSVLAYLGEERRPAFFSTLEAGLKLIFELSVEKRIAFIIDGVSCAAKTFPKLMKRLNEMMEAYQSSSQLMLILCSSSRIFADRQLLGQRSLLYEKEDLVLFVPPFDFEETRRFMRKFNDVDLACIYGVTGGVVRYLEKVDENLTVESNIKRLFLQPSGDLYGEAEYLLRQEIREPGLYNAILSAVAQGRTRLSEIAMEIGEETSATATYMRSLLSAGLIRKEFPCGEENGRRTLYRIDDEMMAFWYRFIPTRINWIQQGYGDGLYRDMQPEFQQYMGEVFEKICMQYIIRLQKAGRMKINCREIGPWWGPDPDTREDLEIGIMGTDGGTGAIFGSCFWQEEKVDADVIGDLKRKSDLFSYPEKEFYLFAKRGFTRRCIEKANAMGNVTLVAFVS